MANELYIYTTPAQADVSITLDTGERVWGQPCVANGREDAHSMPIPANAPAQGSQLIVECAGYHGVSHRGLLIPSSTGEAKFQLDDVHLEPIEKEPPPPGPNPYANPLEIINAVWATGDHEMETKGGCGRFTEACCEALHMQHSEMWGHIAKPDPGQNQYNHHAVDAIQLLAKAGETVAGIYDIIHDSESPNATPVFNYKGEPDPNLWFYPADPVAGMRLVAVPANVWRPGITTTWPK